MDTALNQEINAIIDGMRRWTAPTEIEYAQALVVTSSRKFDLNKPFSLVPDGFDRDKNTMRSLLIGCNYTDTPGP